MSYKLTKLVPLALASIFLLSACGENTKNASKFGEVISAIAQKHNGNIVHRPSSIVHRPSSIVHRPSSIRHQTSDIRHQPSAISHQPIAASTMASILLKMANVAGLLTALGWLKTYIKPVLSLKSEALISMRFQKIR